MKVKRVERKIQPLSERYGGGLLQFVYEAGPCGNGLYRELLASGHDVQVVAPSRIPRRPVNGSRGIGVMRSSWPNLHAGAI